MADYEERAAEAQQMAIQELEALLSPITESKAELTSTFDGGNENDAVEVEPCDAEELQPVKLLGHFVFPGAREGSLHKVCVRVLYSDGSRSDYIPIEPFAGSPLLNKYLKSKQGQKIHKYPR